MLASSLDLFVMHRAFKKLRRYGTVTLNFKLTDKAKKARRGEVDIL